MSRIDTNVSLKNYNTFGIDANALKFISIDSEETLIDILKHNSNQKKFVLGGGSNMLLTKNIDALVLHIDIKGKEIFKEKDDFVIIKASAGENWHEFVLWCIHHDFGGIENLSLIPGNVGTAPIQNIGAYGIELKDIFHSCEALNIETQQKKTFNLQECQFDYRNSIFKNELKGQYIVTSVNFKLTKINHKLNTSYGAIVSELEKSDIKNPTIRDVSNAVITIRQSKLPDPKKIGNSGSFYKNPIVKVTHYDNLKQQFPEIPCYKVSEEEVKVPAGWLIEKAGFKGKTFGDYGVHKKQALVLVNYGNAKGKDIYNLSKLIQKTILRIFDIDLEREVNAL